MAAVKSILQIEELFLAQAQSWISARHAFCRQENPSSQQVVNLARTGGQEGHVAKTCPA